MTIGRLIGGRSPSIVSCDISTSVGDAIGMLAQRRIGAMPVFANSQIAGIFSERDVLYQLHGRGTAILDWPVKDIMTAPAVTVTPETEVLAALSLMTERRIRHLPVMDQGEMIDFVSIGDLVKYRIGLIEEEASAMRAYIQAA